LITGFNIKSEDKLTKKKKQKEYRIKFFSPEFKSTHKQLREYIVLMHNKCRLANAVFGGYEHKINVLETQLSEAKKKIMDLEIEKFPPMDKINELPEVAESDIPFSSEEN